MSGNRERGISEAFVSLANSLVDGADVVDLLSGLTADCARLLDVAAAGLLLADQRRVLHVVAASSERTRSLELFQLQRDEGPCLDCFHSGEAVTVPDLSEQTTRWPQFVAAAEQAGFVSVHALPMRLRDNVLGTLGLFGTKVGSLEEDDLRLGQALAHVASVALVAEKASADKTVINEQLQSALSSRVIVEQAKGLLAQLGSLDMDAAFAALRGYARDHNLRLSDLSHLLVTRELPTADVLDHAAVKATRTQRTSS
jgi:transcriptional regulator with GAF, ATPase, and Fis domain